MNNQEWRVLDGDGNEQGPYSFEDLQSYYTSGNITHETMIWTEGLAEWVPAGQVEGLLPDIPQVVALAPATQAAPMAQPIAAGGINLSPQMSAPNPAGQKPKNGAPTWISAFTILIGITALALYFLPWVSVSQDVSMTVEKDIVKLFTQSGMQSITKDISATEGLITATAQNLGLSEDEVRKMMDEGVDKEGEDNFEKSTLNLIAMIAVGIGLILALIGFLNQGKGLILLSQMLFVVAAILIGSQMAMQFPVVSAYIEEQEKAQEMIDATIAAQEEMFAAASDLANASIASANNSDNKEEAAKLKKESDQQMKEMTDSINQTRLKAANRYKTAFEPSCYTTIGLLGVSLLLLVVTMSSGDASTIVIPQADQGGQAPQPGSGLKFH